MTLLKKNENKICLIIWAGIFLLETIFNIIQIIMAKDGNLDFKPLFQSWRISTPFFVICIIHHFWIGPIITEKGKVWQYLLFTIVTLIMFSIIMVQYFPNRRDNFIPPRDEALMHELPPQFDKPQHMPNPGPPAIKPQPMPKGYAKNIHPIGPSFMMILLGLLMIGADLGFLYYMKSLNEKKRIKDLERENLKYRLDYLRFQINPHFFMNTLNNIHALVDIDGEKAKESIVELSKLMRHVLYRTNSQVVPLPVEIDFLGHYISLMKIRFRDHVTIDVSSDDSIQDAEIPPLVLTTIVENAFKHGISYSSDCFVKIYVSVDNGKIVFQCSNKIIKSTDSIDDNHGIGLENVTKRLNLIYENDYLMKSSVKDDVYELLLVIPAHQNTLKDNNYDESTGN